MSVLDIPLDSFNKIPDRSFKFDMELEYNKVSVR